MFSYSASDSILNSKDYEERATSVIFSLFVIDCASFQNPNSTALPTMTR